MDVSQLASIAVRSLSPQDIRVSPPGSKSITNRALLLAALSDGASKLSGVLRAEDTDLMRECLTQLGVELTEHDSTTFTVHGKGGELAATRGEPLFVGTAGTAARFLTAVLAATGTKRQGTISVDGSPRMRERPMAQLLDALTAQGASLRADDVAGCLPLSVLEGSKLRGGQIRFARPASSQFISALLLSGLFADEPTTILLEQGAPARPYVDMTLNTMAVFGGKAEWSADEELSVTPGALSASDYLIEPDASAASYFLALGAISGSTATIDGLGSDSVQGDAGFYRVLETMGAVAHQTTIQTQVTGKSLRGAELDLTDMPDMTLTAAVVALYAQGPTTIRGVEILRHHESDRIAASAAELRKLGAEVKELDDGLHIVPPASLTVGAQIETYKDHRMAMAFALCGDVTILDPGCVNKTYPRYFDELQSLGMLA